MSVYMYMHVSVLTSVSATIAQSGRAALFVSSKYYALIYCIMHALVMGVSVLAGSCARIVMLASTWQAGYTGLATCKVQCRAVSGYGYEARSRSASEVNSLSVE